MASNNKRKTTMAKIDRESRLRDRRMKKAIRRDARKNAPPEALDLNADPDAPTGSEDAEAVEAVAPQGS